MTSSASASWAGAGNLLSVDLLGIKISVGLHLITVGTLSGWGDTMGVGRAFQGQHHGRTRTSGSCSGPSIWCSRMTASHDAGRGTPVLH